MFQAPGAFCYHKGEMPNPFRRPSSSSVPHDPFHIIVTLAQLKAQRRQQLLRLIGTWAACLLVIVLSVAPIFREAAIGGYVGQSAASAVAPNVTVNFGAAVQTVAPYAFSGTISTYGQDGGSIINSSKQRSELKTLGLGLYRVPLQWNGGNIVSSAGGHPSGSGDAWISDIRAAGGTPMIVLGGTSDNNFTPQDAQNMVQHFNSNAATKVTYWVIGNEPNNGGMSIQNYCTLFNNTVDAMKSADSSIKVAGPAWSFFDSATLTSFLQCAGSKVDIIDYHHYAMGESNMTNSVALSETSKWGDEIFQTRALINKYAAARASQIDIQVGEYNWSWRTADGWNGWNGDDRFFQAVNTVWSASVAGHIMQNGGRGHQYADQNGALSLTFEKNSDASHYGRSVGDPMPIYYGLAMFTGGGAFRPFGGTAVQASTSLSNTEVFASSGGNNIVLINKDPSATQQAIVTTTGVADGTADVWQTDQNAPFSAPTKKSTATISSSTMSVNLPPYSVTTLVVSASGAPPAPKPAPAPTPTPPAPQPQPPVTTPAPSNPSPGTGGGNSTTPTPIVIGSTPNAKAPVVSGTIQLAPSNTAANTQNSYQVDGKPITGTTIDTKQLSNGQHTITVTQKTASGKTTTVTQKIIVKNKLTRAQQTAFIAKHYGLPTVALIAAVAVLVIASKRYIHWRYIQKHPVVTGTTLDRFIRPAPPKPRV